MAEINALLSPKAEQQLETLTKGLTASNEALTKIAKSWNELNKQTKKAGDNEKQLDSITKEGNKLLNQRNTLIAKQDKNLEKLTKDVILAKEQEKKRIATIKEELGLVKKQDDAYQKLSKKYTDTAKRAKALAVQYGANSKEAKQASKEALILNSQLKKIDASVGQNQRSVGSYFKTLVNFAGQLGLVTGVAALFKKGLDTTRKSILSIQTTGDKFTNRLEGWREGYNSFLRSIASGTSFGELIKNFRDAIKIGAEYSAMLDDLGDRHRALRIAESEARLEQEKLLTTTRDVSKADEERMEAIERYIKLETELVEKRKVNAQIAYNAELLVAQNRSKLNKEQIEDYLKTYGEFNTIERQYAEKQQELKDEIASGGLLLGGTPEQQAAYANQHRANIARIEKDLEGLNNKRIEYIDILDKSNQLDDTIRDRLVNSYTELINVETNSLKTSQRVLTMRGALIKRMNDEKNKTKETALEIEKIQNIKADPSNSEKYMSFLEMESNLEKENHEDVLSYIQKEEDAKNAAFEAEKLRLQMIADLRRQGVQTTLDVGNALFEIGANQRDAELTDLEADYTKRIELAEGNEERQEALEAELAEKQKAIKIKQFQAEKNQALFNVGVSTLERGFEITSSALALTAAATLNPALAPLIPLAWAQLGLLATSSGAQIAAIQSREIPAFFNGTSDTPYEFTAGEKGSELMIKKDGSIELTPDRTTLYRGKEYQHAAIIPNQETQKILAYNGIGKDPEMIKELRLTRKAIENSGVNVNIARNMPKINADYIKRKHKWSING